MLKISDTIKQLLQESPILQFGFSQKLFNLTQLAKFIQQPLETRLQKEIQPSAITMNLSRLQKTVHSHIPIKEIFTVNSISVRNNLATVTYPLTPKIEQLMQDIETESLKNRLYFTVTHSTSEITVCCERSILQIIHKKLSHTRPKYKNESISALRVNFSEAAAHSAGLIYLLVQTLNLQGINIVEIASTYTEIIFFIETKDIKLGFSTLHDSFVTF